MTTIVEVRFNVACFYSYTQVVDSEVLPINKLPERVERSEIPNVGHIIER